MKETKLLSSTEYNGLIFSLEEAIKRQVNKEENKWYKNEAGPLPVYIKPPKPKFSAGFINFIRQLKV